MIKYTYVKEYDLDDLYNSINKKAALGFSLLGVPTHTTIYGSSTNKYWVAHLVKEHSYEEAYCGPAIDTRSPISNRAFSRDIAETVGAFV